MSDPPYRVAEQPPELQFTPMEHPFPWGARVAGMLSGMSAVLVLGFWISPLRGLSIESANLGYVIAACFALVRVNLASALGIAVPEY